MVQVTEHPPSKHKALSSTPQYRERGREGNLKVKIAPKYHLKTDLSYFTISFHYKESISLSP
jgi:hypothetical protein